MKKWCYSIMVVINILVIQMLYISMTMCYYAKSDLSAVKRYKQSFIPVCAFGVAS